MARDVGRLCAVPSAAVSVPDPGDWAVPVSRAMINKGATMIDERKIKAVTCDDLYKLKDSGWQELSSTWVRVSPTKIIQVWLMSPPDSLLMEIMREYADEHEAYYPDSQASKDFRKVADVLERLTKIETLARAAVNARGAYVKCAEGFMQRVGKNEMDALADALGIKG